MAIFRIDAATLRASYGADPDSTSGFGMRERTIPPHRRGSKVFKHQMVRDWAASHDHGQDPIHTLRNALVQSPASSTKQQPPNKLTPHIPRRLSQSRRSTLILNRPS